MRALSAARSELRPDFRLHLKFGFSAFATGQVKRQVTPEDA
jgi:hypothetical protein